MTQNGVVRETGADGYAQVRITQRTACGHSCEDCGGCAAGSRELLVRARNPLEARAGETVTVASRTGRVLGAAALVYALPLALMLLTALLCAGLGGTQTVCAAASVLALGLGSGLAVWLGRARHKSAPLEYVIVERITPRMGNENN